MQQILFFFIRVNFFSTSLINFFYLLFTKINDIHSFKLIEHIDGLCELNSIGKDNA